MSKENIAKLSIRGEEWRDLSQFPGYAISSYGRVYSYYKHRLLPLKISNFRLYRGKKVYSSAGYYSVALQTKKKSTHRFVHHLVARTFIVNDDPKVKTVVDHIDNDPLNNMASNLRWVTAKDNLRVSKSDETQKYTRWLRRHIAIRKESSRS